MVLRLATAADQLLEITSVTKLHDYKDFSIGFVYYAVVVFHDIRMV